jgi:hypothetical protein
MIAVLRPPTLASGGLAYTVGAIIYARRRPDPAPLVFGYHELFHALTIRSTEARERRSRARKRETRITRSSCERA